MMKAGRRAILRKKIDRGYGEMNMQSVRGHAVAFLFALLSCALVPGGDAAAGAQGAAPKSEAERSMNVIAESYVKLALAVGEHDPLYVDAYFGPEAWREQAMAEKLPLAEIGKAAVPLIARLEKLAAGGTDELLRLRRVFLLTQLRSLAARVSMLEGAKLSFDEESKALYDIVAPRVDERRIRNALAAIDSLVPSGEGTLLDRLEHFKKDLVIPKDRLDAVFAAAIDEARRRTRDHISLPADESFTVEYVTGEPWGAYNWYKGSYRSVIQINTDFPTYIDAPLGLACHEGYPGHHVQNVLFERDLVKERGWIEFTLSPLFGPLSPINEGAASFAVEVAFPGDSRLAFERDVLCPMAGVDPAKAEKYLTIAKLLREVHYAENEAARRYLDGEISAEESAKYLSDNALMSAERARRLVTFFDRYRSYIVNYNVGYDLVKDYIERRGGTADHPERRWEELHALIAAPHVPSELE
jgi:hypothetical protein